MVNYRDSRARLDRVVAQARREQAQRETGYRYKAFALFPGCADLDQVLRGEERDH